MNNVNLIGRLTRDPELRQSSNGTAFCKFTLAVNRPFDRDNADFINCVAWKKQAENLVKYQKKGSQVGIVGSIQTNDYIDKNGAKVYTTEINANQIMFLSAAKSENTAANTTTNYGQASSDKTLADFQKEVEDITNNYSISNDDLPF